MKILLNNSKYFKDFIAQIEILLFFFIYYPSPFKNLVHNHHSTEMFVQVGLKLLSCF